MTRAQYIHNQKVIQARVMNSQYEPVYQALQVPMKEAAELVKKYGIKDARSKVRNNLLNSHIGSAVTDLYIYAAQLAKKKYRVQKKAASDFVSAVLEFFKQFLLNKVVVPISRKTVEVIEDVLDKAIQEGWGVEQAVKELENTDITKNRARTIVRTESIRAMNYAQLIEADDEDFEVEKEWIAIEDKRTRKTHSHAGVDGEVRGLYEPFSNGMMFPGDPAADPKDTINCRCTLGYRAKRDENGRLVRKQKSGLNLISQININR